MCLLLLFLFRTNGRKGRLDENDIHIVMVVFLKVPFWKLLDNSYVQCSFWAFMMYSYNNILKGYPTVEYFSDMEQLAR